MLIEGKHIEDYQFFKSLIAMPVIEAVYLTSSRARGDNDPLSDLDLAIMCPTASEEEWLNIKTMVRFNGETLLRIDPIRLDKVLEPKHRNFLMQKRQLLYLKTYGGDHIILQRQIEFFTIWHEKLLKWTSKMLPLVEAPNTIHLEEAIKAFQNAFDCIWVIVRKCVTIHGMHTNTPITSFREAYIEGWIENRLLFEQMVQDYSISKASNEEQDLIIIYPRLPEYVAAMHKTSEHIMEVVKPYAYALANA